MTENQKLFVAEYIKDRNATRAYKAAYPHVKSDEAARVSASKLLTKPNILKAVDEQLEALKNAAVADADEILRFHTSVLRGEAEGEELVNVFIGDGLSEPRHITKKPSIKDKQKSAEALSKLLGLEKSKFELSGSLTAETSKLDALIEQMNGGG